MSELPSPQRSTAADHPLRGIEVRERLEKTAALVRQPDEEGWLWFDCEFRALGSECGFYFHSRDEDQAYEFRRAALDWLSGFEARFSRFLPDSIVSAINARAGTGEWIGIDRDMESLLDLCEDWNFRTGGAFDATSLPLSRLWNWKASRDQLPTPEEIASARQRMGWKDVIREPGRIRLDRPGMELDLGGVGKEYAADSLRTLGIQVGLPDFMISLGGDITVHGTPQEGGDWEIGLEDPEQTDDTHSDICLPSGMAVATSGDYRRCFNFNGVRYGHILDCRTGMPVTHGTCAVSVVAKHCTLAGLASTSAMILGGTEGLAELNRMFGVEGCLLSRESLLASQNFDDYLLDEDDEEEG
ncbi:MAG: FAD:protein FMN transferase [Verrucomicrobiales bacterium]